MAIYDKKVGWEDEYCFARNVAAIDDTDGDTTGVFAGTHGITATTNGLLLDERPSFDAGTEINTYEKTTGLAQKKTGSAGIGAELAITGHMPKLSIGSMGMTEYKMGLLAWSLFQTGTTQATTPFVKTYIPYVQGGSDPEMWLEFGRAYGDQTDAIGQFMNGGIVNSLSVTGTNGDRFTMGIEVMGRKLANNYDHSASNFVAETVADHVFLDYSWTLDSNALLVQSLDFTISNNAVPVRYNDLYTTGYTLNRMTSTGNMAIAMSTTTEGDHVQLDSFIAGTDSLLVGTHSSSKIIFTLNLHYTGSPSVDPAEVEHLVTCPFDGVYDGTNHVAKMVVADAIDRGIT